MEEEIGRKSGREAAEGEESRGEAGQVDDDIFCRRRVVQCSTAAGDADLVMGVLVGLACTTSSATD